MSKTGHSNGLHGMRRVNVAAAVMTVVVQYNTSDVYSQQACSLRANESYRSRVDSRWC